MKAPPSRIPLYFSHPGPGVLSPSQLRGGYIKLVEHDRARRVVVLGREPGGLELSPVAGRDVVFFPAEGLDRLREVERYRSRSFWGIGVGVGVFGRVSE